MLGPGERTSQASADTMSLLGPTLVVRGEVLAHGDVELEGQVEGPVWAEGQAVTVAEHAVVTGNIVGRDITVAGTVDGTLLAVEVVDIRSTGRVTGRIVAGRLILANGGVFNGRVEPHQVDAALRVARHRRK
jgi:cytoskeletal protein CcmA (bactofilin family)